MKLETIYLEDSRYYVHSGCFYENEYRRVHSVCLSLEGETIASISYVDKKEVRFLFPEGFSDTVLCRQFRQLAETYNQEEEKLTLNQNEEEIIERAWHAWIYQSRSNDTLDQFSSWVKMPSHCVGSGTTADQVQNFYSGFIAANEK